MSLLNRVFEIMTVLASPSQVASHFDNSFVRLAFRCQQNLNTKDRIQRYRKMVDIQE